MEHTTQHTQVPETMVKYGENTHEQETDSKQAKSSFPSNPPMVLIKETRCNSLFLVLTLDVVVTASGMKTAISRAEEPLIGLGDKQSRKLSQNVRCLLGT